MAANIYDICFSPSRPANKRQQNLNILRAMLSEKKQKKNYMHIQKLEFSIIFSFFFTSLSLIGTFNSHKWLPKIAIVKSFC